MLAVLAVLVGKPGSVDLELPDRQALASVGPQEGRVVPVVQVPVVQAPVVQVLAVRVVPNSEALVLLALEVPDRAGQVARGRREGSEAGGLVQKVPV